MPRAWPASAACASPSPKTAALGGTCVNLGCIPKKLYSFAAHYADSFEESRGFGWSHAAPSFDWSVLKANRAREISRLNRVYGELMTSAGVTILRGRARLVGAGAVEVDGVVHAPSGSSSPPAAGRSRRRCRAASWRSARTRSSTWRRFPKRLVVVGGGYIACEFASIFNGLGASVTQLYRGEQILRGFDREVRDFVAVEMSKHGVDIRVETKVLALEKIRGGAIRVALEGGGELEADTVLYATGRAPNTAGLGLEALGVALAPNGAVVVDEAYRSNVPGIFAIGDVIDRVQLTPVALAEAMALVDGLFGQDGRRVDYMHIPTAVFTHPNIGTIGFSEEAARARFQRIAVYRTDFKPLRHTLSGSSERTLMKLVVDSANDKVVGLHMVGADAGETIQGFAVAMKAGATKAVFDATLGIHPTAAEEFVTMRTPTVAS